MEQDYQQVRLPDGVRWRQLRQVRTRIPSHTAASRIGLLEECLQIRLLRLQGGQRCRVRSHRRLQRRGRTGQMQLPFQLQWSQMRTRTQPVSPRLPLLTLILSLPLLIVQ